MAKETLKTLPSDLETRKRLAAIVSEGADEMKNIATHQGALATILSVTKEDLNIDPKFLKTLITFEYDRRESAEKKRAALEDKIEQLNELDILMGRDRVEGESVD